jgi:hypothetical protein
VDAPENSRIAVVNLSIKNINFSGGGLQTLLSSYFPHKSLTCWRNGKEGKIGASEAPQKRLEWGT